MRSRRIARIRERFYPQDSWIHPLDAFRDLIEQRSTKESVILDIGCGRSARMLRSLAPRFGLAIGIDPEAQQYREGNMIIMSGSAYELPLRTQSVDIVVTVNVVEHLEHPKRAFDECNRVLRPNGHMLVITPNRLFPPLWVGQILPHRARQKILRLLFNRREETVFPAYYRANTSRRLVDLLRESGFEVIGTEHLSHIPVYFRFSWLSYYVWALFDRHCLQRESLSGFRHYLICEARAVPLND